MPAVPNATEETPVVLEKVDIGGGNIIKMSPADKKAWQDRQAEDQRSAAAYRDLVSGQAPAEPAADAGSSDAEVLARYLSKDELVTVATRLEVGTSGSKARIAERIVAGENGTAEESSPEEGSATEGTPEGTPDDATPEGTPGQPGTGDEGATA